MRALYVGRFQPFHKGHLHNITTILEENDELIVAVGSAQYSHTRENPFTCGERITMIRREVKEPHVIIIPVPDLNIHGLWVAHLCNLVPRFDLVYANEPLTVRLFTEAGYEVRPLPFYKREIYTATKIREKIIRGEPWENEVPEKAAAFIKKIQGDQRLRDLAQNDR
jgi:nicotinamide-nucleotide adenylyltransferase